MSFGLSAVSNSVRYLDDLAATRVLHRVRACLDERNDLLVGRDLLIARLELRDLGLQQAFHLVVLGLKYDVFGTSEGD